MKDRSISLAEVERMIAGEYIAKRKILHTLLLVWNGSKVEGKQSTGARWQEMDLKEVKNTKMDL